MRKTLTGFGIDNPLISPGITIDQLPIPKPSRITPIPVKTVVVVDNIIPPITSNKQLQLSEMAEDIQVSGTIENRELVSNHIDDVVVYESAKVSEAIAPMISSETKKLPVWTYRRRGKVRL